MTKHQIIPLLTDRNPYFIDTIVYAQEDISLSLQVLELIEHYRGMLTTFYKVMLLGEC